MKLLPVFLALFAGQAISQTEAPLNTLTPAEEAAGFELLWDGQTIDNSLINNWNAGNLNWEPDDDALLCQSDGEDQSLCTAKEYESFEFKFDMKLGNNEQNSGVFYHRWEPGATIFACGEMGIQGEPHSCSYECHTGDDYHMKAASEYPQELNEYTSVIMFFNGNFIEYWIGGIKVNEFELHSDEWNDWLNADGKYPKDGSFCKEPRGHLCLQDHGGNMTNEFWLRNLKIRPFTADGVAPGPMITIDSLSPDSASVMMEVAMTGATIRYTLDGSDPTELSTGYIAGSPLMVGKGTTIKASTFRERFTASEAASAEFTGGTTGINHGTSAFLGMKIVRSQHNVTLKFTQNVSTRIILHDVSGKEAASYQVINADSYSFSTGNLATGIYTLRAVSGNDILKKTLEVF